MGAATTISVVVIISSILIIAGYFGTQFFFKTVEVQRENTFCANWYNSLEERKAQMENAGFWESLNYDYDQYNAEVAQYNKECYY